MAYYKIRFDRNAQSESPKGLQSGLRTQTMALKIFAMTCVRSISVALSEYQHRLFFFFTFPILIGNIIFSFSLFSMPSTALPEITVLVTFFTVDIRKKQLFFYFYGDKCDNRRVCFQCDEGGGNADGIKTEPPEAEEPRAMQKVPSLSDLSDPEASLGKSLYLIYNLLNHLQYIYLQS